MNETELSMWVRCGEVSVFESEDHGGEVWGGELWGKGSRGAKGVVGEGDGGVFIKRRRAGQRAGVLLR